MKYNESGVYTLIKKKDMVFFKRVGNTRSYFSKTILKCFLDGNVLRESTNFEYKFELPMEILE